MTTPPSWALSLIYWFHMLATVIWIGGLATLSIIFLPVARQALEPEAYTRLLAGVQKRLDPLGWMSLLVLIGTGMFQMSANPNYEGFLAVGNRWSLAILIKHILFLVMTGVSAYLTWGLIPKLQRIALRQVHGQATRESQNLQKQEDFLLRLNFLLGVAILALTALARTAT